MRNVVSVVVVVFLLGTATFVLAQEEKGKMGEQEMKGMMGEKKCPMMGKGMMMDKEKMGAMRGMMPGMMMHGKMSASMVATPDGGVIVLSGNTLTKYDKNLNVVKEVELKCCGEGMEKCPMMRKGMKYDGDDEDMKQGSAEEKAEHESHHK